MKKVFDISSKGVLKKFNPDGVSTPEAPFDFDSWKSARVVVLPSSVKIIKTNAFSDGCKDILQIVFNEGLKKIEKHAFSGCGSLSTVELPSSLEEIEFAAFYGCSSLGVLILPFVGKNALPAKGGFGYPLGYLFGDKPFKETDEVEQVRYDKASPKKMVTARYYVPHNLTHLLMKSDRPISLYPYTFQNIPNLHTVSVMNADTVCCFAFLDCPSLRTVEFSVGLKQVEYGAFKNCNELTKIDVPANSAKYSAHKGWIIEKQSGKVVVASASTDLPDDGSVKILTEGAMKYIPYQKNSLFFFPKSIKVVESGVAETAWRAGLKKMYYGGNILDFTYVDFGGSSFYGLGHPQFDQYDYSAFRPIRLGDYWHYGKNGEIVEWPKEQCGDSVGLTTVSGSEARSRGLRLSDVKNEAGVSYVKVSLSDDDLKEDEKVVMGIGSCKDFDVKVPDDVRIVDWKKENEVEEASCKTVGATDEERFSESRIWCINLGDSTKVAVMDLSGSPDLEGLSLGRETEWVSFPQPFLDGKCDPLPLKNFYAYNKLYSTPGGLLYSRDLKTLYRYPSGRKTETVTIATEVTRIAPCAFRGDKTIKKINFPSGLCDIGSSAFMSTALVEVHIPEGVTRIKAETFRACPDLSLVSIPSSVTIIDPYAFEGCKKLKTLILAAGSKLTAVFPSAFSGCPQPEIINGPESARKKILEAFAAAKELQEKPKVQQGLVKEPEKPVDPIKPVEPVQKPVEPVQKPVEPVQKPVEPEKPICEPVTADYKYETPIADHDSEGLLTVKDLSLSQQQQKILLKEYGDLMFTHFVKDPKDWPRGYNEPVGFTVIRGIGECKDQYVKTPENYPWVLWRAEKGESQVKSIRLANGVEKARLDVRNHKCLTRIHVGKNTQYLRIIDSPEELNVQKHNKSSVLEYSVEEGNEYFAACGGDLCSKDLTVLYRHGASRTDGAVYRSPKEIKKIMPRAFYADKKLGEIILTDVDEIKEDAFVGCSKLKKADLSSVRRIGEQAFLDCRELEYVKLSNKLESMEYFSFANCFSVKTVEYDGTLAEWCAIKRGYASLNYPTLIVNGQKIEGDIVIPDGVKKLPGGVFSYVPITSVFIPAGVEKIPGDPFYHCDKLRSITIDPASNLQILGCMRNLKSLEKITLPASLKKIDQSGFACCYALKEIDIPDGVREIGRWSFGSCISLTSVRLPAALESVADSMFADCSALEKVWIPAGIKKIEMRAFADCGALREVHFAGSKEDWEKIEMRKEDRDAIAPFMIFNSVG